MFEVALAKLSAVFPRVRATAFPSEPMEPTGSNPALMVPLQAIDFSGLGWKENEWLRAEWVAISKNVVRVLFPNEDPNAVVAKETQFRKRAR